jgi:6,7-dimethyl-8-ribityllumazine synthase
MREHHVPDPHSLSADFTPLSGQALRIAVVVSRFNGLVTQGLLDGAVAELERITGGMGQADVTWVPGVFEIPQIAARILRRTAQDKVWRYSGVLTMGCLIEGETDHYRVLADEVTRRLGELSVTSDIPLAFGVLTCRSAEQALARSMPGKGNKGAEAMRALLEMSLLAQQA